MPPYIEDKELQWCPFCTSDRVPLAGQPYPSLHAATVLFKCGTDLTITIGQDGYVIERSCASDEEDCAEWREYNGY